MNGCGTVGRAVDPDTRDPCSNPANDNFYTPSTVIKRQNKEKEAGNDPIL